MGLLVNFCLRELSVPSSARRHRFTLLSSKLNYLNPYQYKSESHNSLASTEAILHSFCNKVFILQHAGS